MQLKQKFERKVMKLSDLKVDPDNPNSMNTKQKKALGRSMSRYGYVQDIIVDKKTLFVTDGQHRLEELKEKGVTEAEVIIYPFKNEADRRMFRQISNKLRGQHSLDSDAEEYRKILENSTMEDLAAITAISEQEILNTINSMDEDVQKATKEQQIQVSMDRKVDCPHCGKEINITKKGEVKK